MSTQQKFNVQEDKYIYHKVMMGETLSSIAKQYGLTVRQLRRENRDLRFPQVGDQLRIPGVKKPEVQETEQVKADSVTPVLEEMPERIAKPAGFTLVKDLRGTLDVAVLLPFYLAENSSRTEIDSSKIVKGVKNYREIQQPDDWIYPESIDFLEMYQGILLAADTLRSMGLNINLHVYDIKSDTIEITKLIRVREISAYGSYNWSGLFC